MRLSFSTRGWGDVPWDELVETARDMGFEGIEAYDVLVNEKFSSICSLLFKHHCTNGSGLFLSNIN